MKFIIVLIVFLLSIQVAAQPNTNIILVIGDGMGPAYTAAYRYYADDPSIPGIQKTIFDELLVGMAMTYPDDKTVVTDSAAAATALATGVKTFNGAIGVDTQKKPLTTLLEAAKARGYQTAIVSTSSINHATPASFIAHVDSRQDYAAIADQYIDQRINGQLKVDIMFGGGRQFFARANRDMIKEFRDEGYRIVETLGGLEKLASLPALGLFADDGMESALNSKYPLQLTRMTDKALSLLEKKPFFLLVEASQIDWCGHANDIACAMAEMEDLAATLVALKAFIDRHPATIMVATADHSTGGLSIGAKGQYQWNVGAIKKIKATASDITTALLAAGESWQQVWKSLTGITLGAREQKGMQALLSKFHQLEKEQATDKDKSTVLGGVTTLTLAIINERTHTGWTTTGHTGEDVQVFSYGKNHLNFSGSLDNTDIAKRLFQYLPDLSESIEEDF